MGSNIPGVYSSRELNANANGSVAADTHPAQRSSRQWPSQKNMAKEKNTGAGVQKPRSKTRWKGRRGQNGKKRNA
ncbi:uncharacterized protein F4812DRAFT_456514 [Daldinia caldariorum]|uniref:uncharacterized protein n=1 Tax=Daldinia caldariorum TaxID=326644 RepID=UPI002008DAA5|nr:uncharacterized protein F4812DRAFT_456514 [Daldinia caldariorum]KAI1470503.1 hypothetical protein F4812DRAFT_456514 [Daldinia caldariorum]